MDDPDGLTASAGAQARERLDSPRFRVCAPTLALAPRSGVEDRPGATSFVSFVSFVV